MVPGNAPTDATGASVAAVVLAAGLASRMGSQKVVLPLLGRPLVRWVVDAAMGSRAVKTIVVVGHQADLVTEVLKGEAVSLVPNPDYAQGMSTSLQAGLRAGGAEHDGAVFLLGDQPFVTASLVDLLIERFEQTGKAIIRPVVDGRPTNPVLMSKALYAEILRQRGDVGGRRVVEQHSEDICLVAVDDPGLLMDIDSASDYEAARESMRRTAARTGSQNRRTRNRETNPS